MRVNSFTPSEELFNVFDKKVDSESKSKFSTILKDNIESINKKQVYADTMTEKFILGEDVEIHEVMLAAEEAKMSLQLAVQIRNKVVEAVKELSNMQL